MSIWALGATVLLVSACIIGFLHWSNKSIVITRYLYRNEKLPKSFDGYRITQVSDLQSEYFGKAQRNLIKKVEYTHPDIIVFTGDLLDRNHTDFAGARIAMERLRAIAPVYYVNGNHEMSLDETIMNAFYEEMSAMGITLLFDRRAVVGKDGMVINLLGLSEHTLFACKGFARDNHAPLDRDMLKQALWELRGQAEDNAFTILLTHEPQHLEAYGEAGFDMAFAGHAHGGQIRLPMTRGLYAPGQGVLPKLTAGMHTSGETTLVISRGLGNSTFPFRLFNRPEVVAVEVRKK